MTSTTQITATLDRYAGSITVHFPAEDTDIAWIDGELVGLLYDVAPEDVLGEDVYWEDIIPVLKAAMSGDWVVGEELTDDGACVTFAVTRPESGVAHIVPSSEHNAIGIIEGSRTDEPEVAAIWWDDQDPHNLGMVLTIFPDAPASQFRETVDSGEEVAELLAARRGLRLAEDDVREINDWRDALLGEEAR